MGGDRRTLAWTAALVAGVAGVVAAVASRPLLEAEDLRGNFAFLLLLATLASIPLLVILRRLVPEVPLRLLGAGMLIGAGPATFVVVRLGGLYEPAGPISADEYRLYASTIPPIVEESVKAVSTAVLLVAFIGARSLTRRHGVAVGASVGLGFTVAEVAWYGVIAVQGDTLIDAYGQIVLRFAVLGATGHAVTTALSGIGVADALGGPSRSIGRRVAAFAPWFAFAVATHALANFAGVLVLGFVLEHLLESRSLFDRPVPLPAVWVGGLVSGIVIYGWAIVVVWHRGLRREPEAVPVEYLMATE